MKEEDKIRKEIMGRVKARPYYKVNCLICKKECGSFSEQREMVHYDCYMKWKKSRQKPQ